MPAIENNTLFSADVYGLFDANACEHLVLMLSATYEARPGQDPTIADEQPEVRLVDEHRGDPASSSIIYPADLATAKPYVDVVINGRAYAPRGRKTKKMMVGLRVADITKTLRVSGDRFWRRRIAGRVPSSPRPFETMPIIYERAFGGSRSGAWRSTKIHFEARNPVGVGIRGASSVDESVETEVPNIEYASSRMRTTRSRPQPAGFAAIAPGWQPRVAYAGTYDDAWLKEQAPLLPHDFDARFYQVAPGDQQSRSIRDGDMVEVVGMTPEGRWNFTLPRLDVPVHLAYWDRIERTDLKLSTVFLEPDQYRVTLKTRLTIPVIRNRPPLDQITLGKVGRGWIRAFYAGKVYNPLQEDIE